MLFKSADQPFIGTCLIFFKGAVIKKVGIVCIYESLYKVSKVKIYIKKNHLLIYLV